MSNNCSDPRRPPRYCGESERRISFPRPKLLHVNRRGCVNPFGCAIAVSPWTSPAPSDAATCRACHTVDCRDGFGYLPPTIRLSEIEQRVKCCPMCCFLIGPRHAKSGYMATSRETWRGKHMAAIIDYFGANLGNEPCHLCGFRPEATLDIFKTANQASDAMHLEEQIAIETIVMITKWRDNRRIAEQIREISLVSCNRSFNLWAMRKLLSWATGDNSYATRVLFQRLDAITKHYSTLP